MKVQEVGQKSLNEAKKTAYSFGTFVCAVIILVCLGLVFHFAGPKAAIIAIGATVVVAALWPAGQKTVNGGKKVVGFFQGGQQGGSGDGGLSGLRRFVPIMAIAGIGLIGVGISGLGLWKEGINLSSLKNTIGVYDPDQQPDPVLVQSRGDDVVVFSQRYHTVQKGETLSAIARLYNTTWQAIAKRNSLSNPNLIQPGQTLVIP